MNPSWLRFSPIRLSDETLRLLPRRRDQACFVTRDLLRRRFAWGRV